MTLKFTKQAREEYLRLDLRVGHPVGAGHEGRVEHYGATTSMRCQIPVPCHLCGRTSRRPVTANGGLNGVFGFAFHKRTDGTVYTETYHLSKVN